MKNTIIRASAGSGKTFRLSNRFLQILFGGTPPDSILASTFTRKAAGEILDRILQRLADAALDEDKRRELAEHAPLPDRIWTTSRRESDSAPRSVDPSPEDMPEADVAVALRELLADLARNLYRLRIGTLDSFFNRIASTLALELGLPPGWSMLEESDFDRCIAEAVRRVLDESDRNGARYLMNLLQKGEQNRNVTRELRDLASELLPLVRESDPAAWNHEHLLQKELDAADLQALLDRFEAAEVPRNKDGSAPVAFVKVKDKIRTLAMNERWKEILGERLIQYTVDGSLKYSGKPIEGELKHCVEELIRHSRAVLLNRLVGQTRATRELLDLVAEAYDEILYRRRGFRFEDITNLLSRFDFSHRFGSLAHRMNARTDHLLLDEFQDTSMSQWSIVGSFAKKSAAEPDGSFFCVGDVKQAIYGWRGGVAGIFDTMSGEIPDLRPESLNRSFRSSPVVIETVNRLFGDIGSNAALQHEAETAKTWGKRFQEHETAKTGLSGYCVLEVAPSAESSGSDEHWKPVAESDDEDNEEEETDDDLFRRYTVERIAALHRERPTASIGVLVFRNKKIGALIAGLRRLGIEASEEGGNPLTDSAAVRYVLSALVLADHPGDRIARFHLATGPLAEPLGLECYRVPGCRDDAPAAACSLRLRKQWVDEGCGALVESLSRFLAPSCSLREFQRLEKLAEQAYRFQEADRGVRTERFVERIRTTRVESPTASPIRIMTIHKSKGLEFDIVVLPDLDKRLVNRTPQLVVARETPTSPVKFVIRYVGRELQPLLPPEYHRAFKNRVHTEIEESLSVLYVAMTRAAHELVMILSPASVHAKKYPATFAGVLRAGLEDVDRDSDSTVLFQSGRADWYRDMHEPRTAELDEKQSGLVRRLDCSLAKRSADRQRNLSRISPSDLEKPPRKPKSTTFSGRKREDALLRGIAIHACFEHGLKRNPWLDRGEPDAGMLAEIVRSAVRGKKGTVDPDEIVRSFLDACAKPGIRAALSLETYERGKSGSAVDRTPDATSPIWEVEHERRFAVPSGDDRLFRGFVDRLVVFRDGGRVLGLDVIDYKTDRPEELGDESEFLAERLAAYRPQLEAYREAMSRLFRIAPSRVSARILFIELDRILAVK